MTAALLYQAALHTDAKPFGKPRLKYPLPGHSGISLAAYQFDQDYEMLLSSFPPAPLNTPSNTASAVLGDADAILTAYSQPSVSNGGRGRFSATFSRVPVTWNDFRPMPFTFPGFAGTYGQTDVREIFTDIVLARLQTDYFLLDPTNLCAGVKDSGGTTLGGLDALGSNRVSALSKIPTIAKSYFVAAPGGVAQPTTRTNSIIPAGGKIINGVSWNETLPNLALYKAWQASASGTGANKGWLSTAWDGAATVAGTVGQLVAEDSQLTEHAGNIIARTTTYILVK